MNNTKLYRILAIIFLTVVSIGILNGCAVKLPESFDEAEVQAAAENVVDLISTSDGQGLTAVMNDQMKAALTEDIQAQIFALVEGSGSFEEIGELKLGGSSQNGIDYAVAVVKAKYENREIIYTISFDQDMKLAGLYLK